MSENNGIHIILPQSVWNRSQSDSRRLGYQRNIEICMMKYLRSLASGELKNVNKSDKILDNVILVYLHGKQWTIGN